MDGTALNIALSGVKIDFPCFNSQLLHKGCLLPSDYAFLEFFTHNIYLYIYKHKEFWKYGDTETRLYKVRSKNLSEKILT